MNSSKIFDYLKEIPDDTLNLLFGDNNTSTRVCTCRALYQLLDPISQSIVTRILFLSEPISIGDIRECFNDSAIAQLQVSLSNLQSLRILASTPVISNSRETIALNPRFREGILCSICDPFEPWSDSPEAKALKIDKKAPTRTTLDNFSSEKWNDLLKFLVGITKPISSNDVASNPQKIQFSIMENFARVSGLMLDDMVAPGKKELRITAKGYEFMLKDRQDQLWDYVVASISRTTVQHEALSLLFMLMCCELGRCYPIEALTKLQRQLVFEFSQLGLIYMHNVASSRFYPTCPAIDLLFRRRTQSTQSSVDVRSEGGEGCDDAENIMNGSEFSVIVETNCQVIAYVTDELHLALLQLFVELHIRLPNMALGRITRDRAKTAFRMGLTAAQIVDFLCSHAHPITLSRQSTENPVVPDNVSDQLKLWEAENFRVKFAEAVLLPLGDLPAVSIEVFQQLVAYARRIGSLLWADEAIRALAVTPQGAEEIQAYGEEALGILT